jgi:hypothetical protein
MSNGDPTMDILLHWAREISPINKLPNRLKGKPIRQANLAHYVDIFLGEVRTLFRNNFPISIDKNQKDYFLQQLTQQSNVSNILGDDINESDKITIALKLWASAIAAAKTTRPTYIIPGGQQSYTIELRKKGFAMVDIWASQDEILRAGVEVAPILELYVRKHDVIVLEGADKRSPIRRYLRPNPNDKFVKRADLAISEQDKTP